MTKVSPARRRPAAAVADDMEPLTLGASYDLPLPESFEDFYRRTYVGLLVLARALVGSSAEDVAQESMLAAYQKWGEVGAMASPVAWVRRVCLNKAVSSLRRAGLERRLLHRSMAAATGPEDADGVAGAEHFWSLVRQLPARQAEAVAQRYAGDLSIGEVADAMACAEGTVKAHLARAKQGLAELVGTEDRGRS